MLIKIWNTISGFGVSPKHPEENDLVRSYNQMSLLSIAGILLAIIPAIILKFSIVYITTAACLLLIYFGTILVNYFEKIYFARFIISLASPLFYNCLYMLIGGYFAHGIANLASIAITYVAFQKRPKTRIILLAFHVILFLFSVMYVNVYGNVFGVFDFPYDEVLVYAGGLGWTTIVLLSFDKDRNRLVNNLKLNNQELKSTTEELERFTYIASHDLKSPLRTIISFIGMIERDLNKGNYDRIRDNLSFVKSGAEQMNFLVQDILELTKVSNFKASNRSNVDLNLVFEKAKLNLKNEIEEKNAIVQCDQLPSFYCNELEFLLLFQNFIQNAIKYNESDTPTIYITFIQSEEIIHLSFQDNGIGIEEEYYEQIFQFFKRLHTSEKYQGTGLGLGLCKKIISSYQGEVSINSTIGSGTCFTLSFPIMSPEIAEPAMKEEEELMPA